MERTSPRPAGSYATGAATDVFRRWRALAWAGRNPRPLAVILDGAALTIIVATFLGIGHPDFNFHMVWVILALSAFLFGLKDTALRIVIATTALVLYVLAYRTGIVNVQLDLIEWPLMFVIAVIVAIMAEWRNATGRHYAALYRSASDRLMTTQEAQRSRLALDLHDGVGQTLTALGLTLDGIDADGAGQRSSRVAHARRLVAVAIDETRDVAERLRPARLDSVGLTAAIKNLAAHAGIPVRVEVPSGLIARERLDADTTVAVFRIVQEALGNAARHAGAKRAIVTVARRGPSLAIDVVDDGHGFDVKAASADGLGLAGMRERGAMIGADLVVQSSKRGTLVRLTLPLSAGVAQLNGRGRTPEPDAGPEQP